MRLWLLAALLLAGCDRASQAPVADRNVSTAASTPAPPTVPAPPPAQSQFPALTGRVVDEADLLRPEEETRLSGALDVLEQRTTDQLIVVTIPSLGGRRIEDYSNDLANHWGIGQAGKDNGVLLMVAPNDRRTRIAIGYGLESVLTDNRAKQIIDQQMLPAFREQRWADGIAAGVDSIAEVLVENADVPRVRRR